MSRALSKAVCLDSVGWYAEVYIDDDGASGYGDNARSGRWYGSRAECESVDPRAVTLYPRGGTNNPDAFDLACERRHD